VEWDNNNRMAVWVDNKQWVVSGKFYRADLPVFHP
jgi:hypothetical protein